MDDYTSTHFSLDPLSAGGLARRYGVSNPVGDFWCLDLLTPRVMAPRFARLANERGVSWNLVMDQNTIDFVVLEFVGPSADLAVLEKAAIRRRFSRLVDYDRRQALAGFRRLQPPGRQSTTASRGVGADAENGLPG